jgi:hypothetical protein
LIPLKTLTTRVIDLLHKQLRKPMESLSPYFRYTQLTYFENSEDSVKDMVITSKDCQKNGLLMIAYAIGDRYIMIIEQDLKFKGRGLSRRVQLKYYLM